LSTILKKIAILGSTGSIGTQALDIIASHPDQYKAEVLCAHSNIDLLLQQTHQFKPSTVVVANADLVNEFKTKLNDGSVKVLGGAEAIVEVVQQDNVDVVLAAIVGYAGLHSTLAAVKANKKVALSNKESLVVAGRLVMDALNESQAQLVPVDSEHSAIFQCLQGERYDSIEKVILTASGGPFRGRKPNFLVNVKAEHALQHPNWTMGAKITVDSATLMNKGLEMIEAKWLFNLNDDQIDVVVHPQSIIHSLVQFKDGSIKAQMGLPSMRIPIHYAISYPERRQDDNKRFDFKDFTQLDFEQPDYKTFNSLNLAREAMQKCGNMPCILNAANEMVVYAFLQNKVGFLEMNDIIEACMQKVSYIANPTLEQLEQTDFEARQYASELLKQSQLSH
jgi:1-deoxy-D-xylulose-5-phosphate reductoisomerase